VAASARADLYGVLLAGLGTMGGRLHGGAPDRARALVDDAHRHGAGAALAGALATGGTVAGFGQPVYPEGDPRARWLLERAGRLTVPAERRTLDELTAVAAERGLPPPNADLGLAALAWAAHLVPDAAGTLFTVARFAGWVAHALEEQQERPLRYRARALYASRPAVSSVSLPPSGP
jgi:citrate synthase